MEKKLAKAGIDIDLSAQLYAGEPAIVTSAKAKNAPETKTVKNKKERPNKKSKKQEPENGNTTLENLLETTMPDSDESDDDDYEPSPEEIAEADEFVSCLLNEESTDENDTTLNRFLNDTIDSDESDDDDYVPTEKEIAEAKAAAQKAAKKLAKIDSNDLVSKKKNKKNKKE